MVKTLKQDTRDVSDILQDVQIDYQPGDDEEEPY